MASFVDDLTNEQRRLVTHLYVGLLHAIDGRGWDETGHKDDCGYTNENPTCDCNKAGITLHQAITDFVAQ